MNKIGMIVIPNKKTKSNMVGRILRIEEANPFTGETSEGKFALVTWFGMGKPERTWWPVSWLVAHN